VKEEGIGATQKSLWSEIVKNVNVPQLKETRVMPKGDLLVKPADEKTYQALKNIENSGKITIKEQGQHCLKA